MVIGKIASIYNQAADSAQLRIRKKWFSKLSKKDFIKKLTNTTFFRDMKLDPEEKLFSGQGVFSNEKEAATWYDAHQIALNELKKESEDYNNDIKKLSKEDFLKKYAVYKHPNFKSKINGIKYDLLMEESKMKVLSKAEAETALNPSILSQFIPSNPLSSSPEPLLIKKPDIKKLEKDWDSANKNSIKKATSLEKGNLANELKELKKLYKDGTLSKDEFAKAKKKLLK